MRGEDKSFGEEGSTRQRGAGRAYKAEVQPSTCELGMADNEGAGRSNPSTRRLDFYARFPGGNGSRFPRNILVLAIAPTRMHILHRGGLLQVEELPVCAEI